MSGLFRTIFVGLLACLLTSVASTSADQSRTTITGTVVNESLTPLVGAVVTLEQGTRVVAKATTAWIPQHTGQFAPNSYNNGAAATQRRRTTT